MEWNEAILFVLAIVILFFGGEYLRKIVSPKTSLIVGLVGTIFLNAMFIINLIDRFTYVMLIFDIAFFIFSFYSWYKRYKEYKKSISVDNQTSSS